MELFADYRNIAGRVLRTYYPDIKSTVIVEQLAIGDDASFEFLVRRNWFSLDERYEISGLIPKSMAEADNLEELLKGLFGHEFAHIALGHLSGLRGIVQSYGKKIPKIGEAIELFQENAANREAIKRGLGFEVYRAMNFLENLARNNGHSVKINGYDSDKLLALAIAHRDFIVVG